MNMATLTSTYTTKDAAAKFGRNDSRIRQICLKYDIGDSIGGRIRVLSEADMRRIGSILDEIGRPRKS